MHHNLKKTLGLFVISMLMLSCGSGMDERESASKDSTFNALQDDKLDIKSYRGKGDLCEELYQELVEKRPELKQLEEDLSALDQAAMKLKEMFNAYEAKSNEYYLSSTHKAATISDSLLKTKILSLIETSQRKYANKTANLNALLKQISKNGARLEDQHAMLKIVLTLPFIEKYQDDNLPNQQAFKDLLSAQAKLMLLTDSLTPKY